MGATSRAGHNPFFAFFLIHESSLLALLCFWSCTSRVQTLAAQAKTKENIAPPKTECLWRGLIRGWLFSPHSTFSDILATLGKLTERFSVRMRLKISAGFSPPAVIALIRWRAWIDTFGVIAASRVWLERQMYDWSGSTDGNKMRWTIQCSVILTALTFSVSGEHHETTPACCIIHMLTRTWKCTASILFRINGLAEVTNQLRFNIWWDIDRILGKKFRLAKTSVSRNFALTNFRWFEISPFRKFVGTKYRLNHAKFRRYFARGVKTFARNFDEISRRTKDEILRISFSLLLISTVHDAQEWNSRLLQMCESTADLHCTWIGCTAPAPRPSFYSEIGGNKWG